MRLGIAILNSGAMHILDCWVRVIAAILNLGGQWALNLRSTWKAKPCAWFQFYGKSQNPEPWRPALTHSPSTHPRDSIAIPASLMRGNLFPAGFSHFRKPSVSFHVCDVHPHRTILQEEPSLRYNYPQRIAILFEGPPFGGNIK